MVLKYNIEFQNDYTVNTCVYSTPTFTMQSGSLAQIPCNPGPCFVDGTKIYINNIVGVPYPNDLKDIYDDGILRLINTSNNVKVLTIGFDIDIPIYAQSCVAWGVTATVRFYSTNGTTNTQLVESAPFFLGKIFGEGKFDCKNILFNNNNKYMNIYMYPNIQYFIYAIIYAQKLGTSCAGGIQMAANYGNAQCTSGSFNGIITFFNYVTG
jgi:hypothetical protein